MDRNLIRAEVYRGVFIYPAKDGWRWTLSDGNHRIIADGSEAYVSPAGVKRAVDNVIGEIARESENMEGAE
jgi:uncharacterized protein YegP (UPF0339 family)